MQCMLCGFRFDETKLNPCGCECAFGGCGGRYVRCPNCGHDMLNPNRNNIKNDSSLLERIKKSLREQI